MGPTPRTHWVKLVFTSSAQEDLNRVRIFLEAVSATAAMRAAQRIKKVTSHLLDHPRIGRAVLSTNGMCEDIREVPIQFGMSRYLIRYQIQTNEIRILRVFHFKENR